MHSHITLLEERLVKRIWAAGLWVVMAAGCFGSSGTAVDPFEGYPAVQAFSNDPLMMVGPPASQGNWAEVKRGAAHPQFIKGAEEFNAAPVPSGLRDGEAMKSDVSAKLNALIEAAKSKKNEEVETAYKEFKAAWDKLAGAVSAAG